jgi:hypothetical protein
MSFRQTAVIVGLAGVLSACGGINSPSQNQVQDFPGTLLVGGSNIHQFSASKTGEFFVTVTALGDRTLTIGTGLGQMVSGGCAPISGFTQSFSRWNQQSIGGPISKGSYCLIVYDPGLLLAPLTYTVQVSHP